MSSALFDLRHKSPFTSEAAALVRTIFTAIVHIHKAGVVHRDLKPENLLFRTEDDDSDIMITDFGLSRIMDEEKLDRLTEICGTPGYMAPEIYRQGASSHHLFPAIIRSSQCT